MMNAYDSSLVYNAQTRMGWMLDFAVNVYRYELEKFYRLFLKSDISRKFALGSSSVLEGKSGRELAYLVLADEGYEGDIIRAERYIERSEEYWTGWVLAYFQWETALSFREIEDVCSISEIRQMYSPYHEMDISQFCIKMREKYMDRNPDTQLKKIRKLAGYSQKYLSERTGIPLKTIQQYEQRQKNINHARVDYLMLLSRELSCEVEALVEKI